MTPDRPSLGRGWTLWRYILVRGAGFPFSMLDEAFRSDSGANALWTVADDPKFREAVTWQNRPVVANALDRLSRYAPGTNNARTRRSKLLVAKYLQRYCAKNDTIGFFGPVGWATIGGKPHFKAGSALISERATFFEPWAVLAVARSAGMGETRLKAPVSLPGHLRLEGQSLRGPNLTLPLNEDELRLVRAVDGRSAESLLHILDGSVAGQHHWQTVLERLANEGVLRWEFPVSVSLKPERNWPANTDLNGFKALCEKRDAVAQAAGDPVALGKALLALEENFEQLTGKAARRNAGVAYAGRSLVFEECRRAISMDLGSAAIERVAPPLQLLLEVARWYTFTVAAQLAKSLLEEYRRLGESRVPLHVFWRHTDSLFDHESPPAVAVVVEQFRERWEKLWDLAQTREGSLHLDVEQAQAFVAKHFPAPCPGWPGARHHAPDLMWDAPGPEAMLAGEGTPVLSELHPGVTPFTTLSVLSLCPVFDDLRAEWMADFPESLVSPIPWEDFARSSLDARLAKDHWHVDLGRDFASDRPADRVLSAADFDVVERQGHLRVVHCKDGPEFDLLEMFERRIKLRAATGFSLSGGAATGLRRYLGPLLVQRAFWHVEAPSFLKAGGDLVLRVQEWSRELNLPARVFVRLVEEVKPIYVDFASEVSVEMFVHFARRSTQLSISEMYPGPEGLWLRDEDGQSYTSELRMIAVDPNSFDAARVWSAAATLA